MSDIFCRANRSTSVNQTLPSSRGRGWPRETKRLQSCISSSCTYVWSIVILLRKRDAEDKNFQQKVSSKQKKQKQICRKNTIECASQVFQGLKNLDYICFCFHHLMYRQKKCHI